MVEAYVNERKSLTSRTYPTRADAVGLVLLAAAGDRVLSLTVWPLDTKEGTVPVAALATGTNK